LVFSPAKQASAQQGIVWSTGFQVQNLGTGAATVTIQLISQDGTTAATISNETIATGGSNTYFPVPQVAGGFNGSAIISATQPVAAILNILGNSGVAGQPFYSEAANGVAASATSTSVSLPLIMRGNGGFNTWFSVQNAGTTAASVTVAFKKGTDGTDLTLPAVSIPPGASHTFDQSTADAAGLGVKFVGSATVTSSQPLAVVVNQVGTGASKTQLTYGGFPSGSNSVALPLIQQSNSTFFTGISIQNVGSVSATVTVSYAAQADGTKLADDTATLAAGASAVFIKNAATKYVGSATVTTGAADQQVVVVVNQLSTVKGFGTAYEGLSTASATAQVSLPLLMNANSGFFTGVQCKNVGTATTTMTLTFTKTTVAGGTLTPAAVTASVASGASANWLQNTIGQKYVGGGLVTTNPASSVVCIVNQLNDGTVPGDAFLTYDGINY
jgi:hypothetical protein